ncbi:hypothetical protein J6590_037070 [Homalodisca vitripennis]|nr:hypothetical protein J6590_037070 [Homalodisca vitripennis]
MSVALKFRLATPAVTFTDNVKFEFCLTQLLLMVSAPGAQSLVVEDSIIPENEPSETDKKQQNYESSFKEL